MKKILLVNSEENHTQFISQMFRESGRDFDVLTACNGLAALQIIRSTPIDLVVTELSMPKMDGLELLVIMGKEFPGLPVIICTAYCAQGLADKCLELGAIKFIESPLAFEQLYNTVWGVLDGAHIVL